MATDKPTVTTDIDAIASACVHDPKYLASQRAQIVHRVELAEHWGIFPGARVLELGCGQGDCTAVLATLVGPEGHVTAVDPGALDYGAPVTLGQAQSHLSNAPFGSRITWVQADPVTFIETSAAEQKPKYDFAILAHCLWYFSTPETVSRTFAALRGVASKICVAEWGLSTARAGPSAVPHLLTVLAVAALECRKASSLANVRTVLAPAPITALAEKSGLHLQSETTVAPGEGLQDGYWEAMMLLMPSWQKDVDEHVKDQRERAVVLALRDAAKASIDALGDLKSVRSMDVWSAVFTPTQDA
ncbi:hypothetical protein HGRIS_002045 [Hohenbuehelia grisea]|uniref:Methyltransferase domain-containing protein n=1 Tax=Hohenbuehelia grisea TaxID=104357 RepID=A0ABR3JKB6_9AGAR